MGEQIKGLTVRMPVAMLERIGRVADREHRTKAAQMLVWAERGLAADEGEMISDDRKKAPRAR